MDIAKQGSGAQVKKDTKAGIRELEKRLDNGEPMSDEERVEALRVLGLGGAERQSVLKQDSTRPQQVSDSGPIGAVIDNALNSGAPHFGFGPLAVEIIKALPPDEQEAVFASLAALYPSRPKPYKPNRAQHKLLSIGAAIADADTDPDLTFTHAIFCLVGLPRSQVMGREFLRTSGTAWLSVQAGTIDEGAGPVQQPIPYGPLPRLALAHISTFAVRHKTREIPIGDSAAQFLQLMDMGDDGRRYKNLRRQMHAMAACRLQLGYKGRTFSGQPIDQFDAWVTNRGKNGQRSLWPGIIILSEHYYNSLLAGAVPLEKRALFALKGSALSLDIYAWLAHRLCRIDGSHIALSWDVLRDQFGQEYQGKTADKDFRKQFLHSLKQVKSVYPQAIVKQIPGGMLLTSSPPPIPYKGGPTT
jgi:hypothetical protein